MRHPSRKLAPLLALALALALIAHAAGHGPASATGAPVRIMPLGDSITHGWWSFQGGYRIKLWADLTEAGYAFDFVGPLRNGPESLGDRDHAGYSGWRIDEIYDDVAGWLDAHQPDVVLLLIGTNDMIQGYAVDEAPARLGALIDRVVEGAPQRRIILATAPPSKTPSRDSRILQYNSALPGLVAEKAAQGVRITLVDAYAGLTLADIEDDVHPNMSGYNKLADLWYAELVRHLPAPGPALTPTATEGPTLTPTATETPTLTATLTPTATETPPEAPTATETPPEAPSEEPTPRRPVERTFVYLPALRP